MNQNHFSTAISALGLIDVAAAPNANPLTPSGGRGVPSGRANDAFTTGPGVTVTGAACCAIALANFPTAYSDAGDNL